MDVRFQPHYKGHLYALQNKTKIKKTWFIPRLTFLLVDGHFSTFSTKLMETKLFQFNGVLLSTTSRQCGS